MTRNIDHFERPELLRQFLQRCKDKGLDVIITCVDRTYLEQDALFAQGREPLDTVNALRQRAGLAPIIGTANRKVTWTRNSKHVVNPDDERTDNDKARAFDFVILNAAGSAVWDVKADVNKDQEPDYLQAGEIAEAIGLKWGGRFRNPDMPHVEIA